MLGTLENLVRKELNNTLFIYYWMSRMSFEPYKTGSTIPHVYFKDYGKKMGLFPHPEEQRKIADFLSAIDTRIALTSEETELTRIFKKGLLQQMFV